MRSGGVAAETADIKRHPTADRPDTLRGSPTDKPGKRLPVSPTCELKATDRHTDSSRFGGKSPVSLIALSPSPHDHSLY